MIETFLNKIYVDPNIPCDIPNLGEHIIEYYTACSRGARLNQKVIVVVPITTLNNQIYSLIPVGCDVSVVRSDTGYAIFLKILLWLKSGMIFERTKKHLFSWIRVRIHAVFDYFRGHIPNTIHYKLIAYTKNYVDSKFYNKQQYYDKREVSNGLTFKMTLSDENISEEYLSRIGFNFRKKFVCLHIRDHINDTDGYNRECSIDTYQKMVKYLESRNIAVVKIGMDSEFECIDSNVVDLAFNNTPNIVQLYLISKCQFVISYQTGAIPHMGYMFNRPVLMLNVIDPILAYPSKYNAMFVLKTLYYKRDNKIVRFDEISNGVTTKLKKNNNFNNEYYYKDNTQDEVLLSVKDMISYIDNGFKKNSDQNYLQSYLQVKNLNILKNKENIGVHNYHMRWSGCDFIGAGALCPWYAKKIRFEIANY